MRFHRFQRRGFRREIYTCIHYITIKRDASKPNVLTFSSPIIRRSHTKCEYRRNERKKKISNASPNSPQYTSSLGQWQTFLIFDRIHTNITTMKTDKQAGKKQSKERKNGGGKKRGEKAYVHPSLLVLRSFLSPYQSSKNPTWTIRHSRKTHSNRHNQSMFFECVDAVLDLFVCPIPNPKQ